MDRYRGRPLVGLPRSSPSSERGGRVPAAPVGQTRRRRGRRFHAGLVSAPLAGHLLPLVSLAHALRNAGHDVRLAAGGNLAPGFRFGPVAGRALGGHPALLLRELRGVAGVAGVGRLFGAVNAQLVQPLLDLAADIAPDVVVHEPLSVAGAVVAARRGAPAVLQENSLWDGAELVTAAARSGPLRAAARRAAVTRLPPPVLRLVTAPPSIVGTAPRVAVAAGPVVRHGDTADPARASHRPAPAAADAQHRARAGRRDAPANRARHGGRDRRRSDRGAPSEGDGAAADGPDHRKDTALRRPALRGSDRAPRRSRPHGGAGTALGALAARVPQLLVPPDRHKDDLPVRS